MPDVDRQCEEKVPREICKYLTIYEYIYTCTSLNTVFVFYAINIQVIFFLLRSLELRDLQNYW